MYTIEVCLDIEDVFSEIPEIFDGVLVVDIKVEYKVTRDNLGRIQLLEIACSNLSALSTNEKTFTAPYKEQLDFYQNNVTSRLLHILETKCYEVEEWFTKQGML